VVRRRHVSRRCAPRAGEPGRLPDTAAVELCDGLALYRGELLDGFFDDWILAEREQLRALYIRGQLRLLDHFITGDEVEAAIECGREVLRLDPLRESVHRRMMALYAGNGEPGAARRQFACLVQLLKEELGVAPAAATLAAYQRL
jgi:DNA-binding SARP family transcriptional activator